MKLCLVTPYFTISIAGNEYALAQSLSKFGHKITILTSKGRAPREIMPKDFGEPSTFKIVYLPTIAHTGTPIVFGLNVRDCDVVLIQESDSFISYRAFSIASRLRIKTILLCGRTNYPESFVKNLFLKILNKTTGKRIRDGANELVAYSSAAKEFLKSIGVEREIKVIHTGVDTNVFKPLESEDRYLRGGNPKILTVARLFKYKGVRYLIESIHLLKEYLPNIRLYILGRGPEERNLKKLVKGLDLGDRIEFLDKTIPYYEMPLLYRECDIYVQPSIIETYGLAVLEAMACGKPVISTKLGVIPDAIEDGKTGFLAEPKNVKELAGKILKLSDERKREEMGEKARNCIVVNFSLDVTGEKFQELLSKDASSYGEVE